LEWQREQGTFSWKPRSGYLVLLWSNSGTARIGRHPAAVWQFSQGIANGPCGLRVVSRCAAETGAPAGCQAANSSSQQMVLTTLRVFAPFPRSSLADGGAAGWTYLNFLGLKSSKQLYAWPVSGHVRGLFNCRVWHRYDSTGKWSSWRIIFLLRIALRCNAMFLIELI